jgi:hypothetical protein
MDSIDETIGERRPQERGHDRGQDDDEAAHRRCPALALVTRGPLGTDDLAHLARPKTRDHGRTDKKRKQERRDRGARGAKADVVEKIEDDVLLAERREPMIEH